MVTFEESGAVQGVVFAMVGEKIVGMIRRESDKRYHAELYRGGAESYKASFTQKHAAEAFLKGNVTADAAAVGMD
jgi:hypothetical protein